MKFEKNMTSADDTQDFATLLGSRLRGGECIEFVSDLGGGKTTFVSGLVTGSGSTDVVSSPTFTIGKQYSSESLRFYHFDFYRLQEPGLVAEELAEAIEDPAGVILVEWAQTVGHVLPEERVVIEIQRQAEDADARLCSITFPESLQYLFEEEA